MNNTIQEAHQQQSIEGGRMIKWDERLQDIYKHKTSNGETFDPGID